MISCVWLIKFKFLKAFFKDNQISSAKILSTHYCKKYLLMELKERELIFFNKKVKKNKAEILKIVRSKMCIPPFFDFY